MGLMLRNTIKGKARKIKTNTSNVFAYYHEEVLVMQEINNTQSDTAQPDTGNENINAYISVEEMARMLSIAKVTAYQLIKTSGFPCFYIGKRIIIPLQSFHKWAEEQASRQSTLIAR